MPGIAFSVENQAGFDDSVKGDIRNYFLLNKSDEAKVVIDWHSYRYDELDTRVLNCDYKRNAIKHLIIVIF